MPKAWIIAVLAACLGASAGAHAQTSITLRPSARVATDAPIRIGDVASVQGDDAERYAAIEVTPSASALANRAADSWITIDVDAVRAAIEQMPDKANWGKLTLSGSRCAVKVGDTIRATPAAADTHDRDQPRTFTATDRTIRSLIVQRLADLYGTDSEGLRLTFNAGRGDSSYLDAVIDSADRVQVDPGASSTSGRVPVRVSIYRGERLTRSYDLIVIAQVKRSVAIASRGLERDEPLDAASISTEERWVSPSTAQSVDAEAAVGTIVKKRIAPGAVLTPGDVQSPIVVRRGDEVWVHVLSHGFVIKAKARALGQARDGEMVKLQVDGSKKTFDARMSGRGVAVMSVDGQTPAAGTEALDANVDAANTKASPPESTFQISPSTKPSRKGGKPTKLASRQELPR